MLTLTYRFAEWYELVRLFFAAFDEQQEEGDTGSEKEMVLAAQKNHRHFEKIYDLYFERIFIYVHRRVKDEAIADDLTSQTFYNALVKIQTFRFQGYPFSSWLYKIATNELNMYFRKNTSATRHVSLQSAGAFELFEESDDSELTHKLEILSGVLTKLENSELQLLEWRFFEERSFKEIGYLLDISDDNAKVKTYRLLEKVRKMMINC